MTRVFHVRVAVRRTPSINHFAGIGFGAETQITPLNDTNRNENIYIRRHREISILCQFRRK